MADITTDMPGLRHFKKVTFVQNDSWPVNFTEGQYHFGDVRSFRFTFKKYDYEPHIGESEYTETRTMNFVCLREKGKGVKPLYVSITPDEVSPHDPKNFNGLLISAYCPGESKAKMIYRLIDDYGFINSMDLFKRAGEGELKFDQYYWYDDETNYVFLQFWKAIRLFDGDLGGWEHLHKSPQKHALLKIDRLDD